MPDTIDGRFDMIAAVLAMVLLRLEDDPAAAAARRRSPSASSTTWTAAARDRHRRRASSASISGRMMGMLGGRLGAYRDGLAAGDLQPALVRNLYRGDAPGEAALAHVERACSRCATRSRRAARPR